MIALLSVARLWTFVIALLSVARFMFVNKLKTNKINMIFELSCSVLFVRLTERLMAVNKKIVIYECD